MINKNISSPLAYVANHLWKIYLGTYANAHNILWNMTIIGKQYEYNIW